MADGKPENANKGANNGFTRREPVVPKYGVQLVNRQPYQFEGAMGASSRRSPTEAQDQLDALLANIGCTAEKARKLDVLPLLLDFIVQHHLNISWYDDRIRLEQGRQRRFFWASVSLLASIPIVTLLISYFSTKPAVVAAQLTAVLSGIIAFQSAIRTLFEKRSIVTLFHKASSELKKAVYEFEDHWAGCVPMPDGGTPAIELFKANIRNAIRKARDVEAEESDAYFANQAGYPLIDLRAALADAGATATQIVGKFALPAHMRTSSAASIAVASDTVGMRVDTLRSKLTALRANATRTANPEQQRIVEQEIAATQQQLADAEQTMLSAAVRQYDALR